MPTTDQFLNDLEQSNLLPVGTVAKIRRRVAEAPTPLDARRTARGLVEKGILSPWQARQLLAGRHAFYLGRYKLLDRIGKGGMGVVFRAQHAMMERTVALKVMSHALLKNPRAVARFNREVKTAAALNHPNIITAYDADAVGSTHFLVMEYVEGQDLNQWLKTHGPLSVAAACECAMQAAEGLGHAHRQGMVHRDIKPVNLFVTWNAETDRPQVKILDMGLARFVSEAREEGGVTRLGQTIGTPDYIAPEAASNFKKADIRADIFSLGCTLYKLLTGRLPFAGENTMEKLLSRTTKDAPAIRSVRPDVPPELDAIVARMLARNPDDRFQAPGEVSQALAKFAASTTGNLAALDLFRDVKTAPRSLSGEKIEPDADSSLEEFIQDFSVAPLRDEGTRTAELAAHGDAPPASAEDSSSASVEIPADNLAKVRKVAARTSRDAAAASAAAPIEIPTDDLVDPQSAAAGRAWGAGMSAKDTKKKAKGNIWDSSLLLVGGGSLLGLLILVGVLWWALSRQTGDEALRLAEEDYGKGSYTQAIAKFNSYLENFPQHPGVSTAKVHLGMARLRQAVDAGGDWSKHLQLAVDILDEIASEKGFPEANAELAALLPKIASGLAEQANRQRDPKLVDQTKRAIALVEKYVSKSLLPVQQLQAIQGSLALTERTLRRDAALAETVAAMIASVKEQRSADAYPLRKQLLKEYPDLESAETLADATAQVTAAQQAAVTVEAQNRPAAQGLPETPVRASLTLISRRGESIAGAAGHLIPVLAEGAAYALDAQTGRVVWRHFVGPESRAVPLAVARGAGADLLLVDARRSEVVRVAGDGQIRWRQNVPGLSTQELVVWKDHVLATAAEGRVNWLELETGALQRTAALPQRLALPPAVNQREQTLYQVAEHSNLFVLSADDGACREVFYLGHAEQSIRTPPSVVNGTQGDRAYSYLVVAENRGAHNGVLRVLLANEQGLQLKQVQELPIEGHMHMPLLFDGRMLHAATDRGALYTFEVGPSDQPRPFKEVVSRPATSDEHVVRFALLEGGQLLIADRELTKYDFQPARGRMDVRWVYDQGDTFLQPLRAIGGAVFHVRRRATGPGVAVSAVQIENGGRVWETDLAVPLAGAPTTDAAAKQIVALSTQGDWHALEWSSDAAPNGMHEASARVELPMPLPTTSQILALDERVWVAAGDSGSPGLVVARRDNSAEAPRWLPLPFALAGQPAPFGKGLLVPVRGGQVLWVDPVTGKPLSEPFQPRLEAGSEIEWRGPAVFNDREWVVADGRNKLFRVALKADPQPHLAAAAEFDVATPLASPLAIAGSTLYAVDAGNSLVSYTLPEMTAGATWKLDTRPAWGPVTVGDRVLLATRADELHCLDAQQKLAWKVPLPEGPLAGPPVAAGDSLLLASQRGAISKLSAATGEVQSRVDVGQPLATSPAVTAAGLVVATQDGTLLRVELP